MWTSIRRTKILPLTELSIPTTANDGGRVDRHHATQGCVPSSAMATPPVHRFVLLSREGTWVQVPQAKKVVVVVYMDRCLGGSENPPTESLPSLLLPAWPLGFKSQAQNSPSCTIEVSPCSRRAHGLGGASGNTIAHAVEITPVQEPWHALVCFVVLQVSQISEQNERGMYGVGATLTRRHKTKPVHYYASAVWIWV